MRSRFRGGIHSHDDTITSHTFVIWSAAALGRDPSNVAVRIGNVAGLAVNAVRGVNREMYPEFIGADLIYSGGTIILARIAVLANAAVGADIPIANVQMARLIFFVTRAGMIDIRQAIESKDAIALKPVGLIDRDQASIELFEFLVARSNANGID